MSEPPDLDPELIDARLVELRPLVVEYHRLQAAREVLAGLRGGADRAGRDGDDEAGRRGAA